jgi:hypothetical protein
MDKILGMGIFVFLAEGMAHICFLFFFFETEAWAYLWPVVAVEE